MKFGIQMGHGMQSIAEDLLKKWGKGTVILSPRNSKASKNASAEEQFIKYANKIRLHTDAIFIDPQLFSGKQPSKNLESFEHSLACAGDLQANYSKVVDKIVSLNEACGSKTIILPSIVTNDISSAWKEFQKKVIGKALERHDKEQLFITVALGVDVLKNIQKVQQVISETEIWDVSGIYLVCEHPSHEYLTDQSLWLLNLMQLVAALKLSGKQVYVGYASHQMLLLTLAKCDYIFSGNFLNVRRFQTSTFEDTEEDSFSRRTKWYYAPQAFSEFKLTSLDIAHQKRVLSVLKTPYDDEEYVGMLFGDALPTDTAYSETNSFKHYLYSLNEQCSYFTNSTYSGALNSYQAYLQTAEFIINGLRSEGIYDRDRNFAEALPANYQAVAAFNSELGFQLSQEWNNL